MESSEKVLVMDYQEGMRRRGRPVHHYSRFERFEAVLGHLCGGGMVPEEIVEEVMERLEDWDPDLIWGRIQGILSRLGERKYFNRISRILDMMGMEGLVAGKVRDGEILVEFKEMEKRFDAVKEGRKYFPNLRYVALRMLVDYGTEFNYRVPLVKTPCKVETLDKIYKRLRQS